MIVRRRVTIGAMLFALRGSILPSIAGRLLVIALVSSGAVLFTQARPDTLAHVGVVPFTLIGLALSIFMSFRNNACYDRWWEGRKLWGQLVIEVRSFARQVADFEPSERAPLLTGLIAFTYGLAARLRERDEVAAIAPWSAGHDWSALPSPTDAVLSEVGRTCAIMTREGMLSDIRYSVLETRLSALSGVQAGCERIKGTPLPFAYSLLLHRTAHIFCLLLPFALAGALGWWAVLVTLVVSYTFFGLDALGDELEDPFGVEVNDLPLDAISRAVERELLSALGRTDLPPPNEPDKYVLS